MQDVTVISKGFVGSALQGLIECYQLVNTELSRGLLGFVDCFVGETFGSFSKLGLPKCKLPYTKDLSASSSHMPEFRFIL